MTFTEQLQIAGLLGGMIAAIMGAALFVLRYFVGLKAPPMRRALLTAGSAYVVAVVAFIFGGVPEYQLWAPVLGLPTALIFGFLEYREYKARWFQNHEDLPEGATLSNDDWRIGVYIIGAIVAAASLKVLLRGF